MKSTWEFEGPRLGLDWACGNDEDAAAEEYARRQAVEMYGPELGFACGFDHIHDEHHGHSALMGRAPVCDEYGVVKEAGTSHRFIFLGKLMENRNDKQE